MKKKKWFIYIILATNDKLYTGITTDIERRFREHCVGPRGAKFFNSSSPDSVEYVEFAENRSEASKREYEIKKLKRSEKIELINSKKNNRLKITLNL